MSGGGGIGESPGDVQRFWWGENYYNEWQPEPEPEPESETESESEPETETEPEVTEKFLELFARAAEEAPRFFGVMEQASQPIRRFFSPEVEMEDVDDTDEEEEEEEEEEEDSSSSEEEESSSSEEEEEGEEEEEDDAHDTSAAKTFVRDIIPKVLDVLFSRKTIPVAPEVTRNFGALAKLGLGDVNIALLSKLKKGSHAEAVWLLGNRSTLGNALLLAAGERDFFSLVTFAAAFSFATQFRRVSARERSGEWFGVDKGTYDSVKSALREIVDNFLQHTSGLAASEKAQGQMPWVFFSWFAKGVAEKPSPFGNAVVAANLFDLCRKIQTLTQPAKKLEVSAAKLAIARACYAETTGVFFGKPVLNHPEVCNSLRYMVQERAARGFRFGDDVIGPAAAAVKDLQTLDNRGRVPTSLFMALTEADFINQIQC